jgi:tRNA threonylcarbamoyladenosine biosynthesis protein TsaB
MLILAMETSTPAGSVALIEVPVNPDGSWGREKILGETTLHLPETHSARLMPAIDSLLRETSLSIRGVQGIALGLGPGSFTGLRIAVSTVKGLAYALKVPVAGVPTLEVLAHNLRYASKAVCPVLDAPKKEVYAALFRGNGEGDMEKIGGDWVLRPEDLCRRIRESTVLLGSGVEAYGEFFRQELGSRVLFAPPELSYPRAANVARVSFSAFQKGMTLDVFSFTPIYLRRSEAEIHWEKKGIPSGHAGSETLRP